MCTDYGSVNDTVMLVGMILLRKPYTFYCFVVLWRHGRYILCFRCTSTKGYFQCSKKERNKKERKMYEYEKVISIE